MQDKIRFRKRYEALDPRNDTSSHSERGLAASDFVKPTTQLPARTLPGRRHKYFGFGVAILITAVTLTAFSLILRNIPYWLPVPQGLYINDESGLSCDLVSSNDSMVEKAFTINLRSPVHFSFATAKGIDVAWDFFVGQGGRLLLASISYIVFMDGLTRLLETSAVSYQLYATMVFDNISLQSAWSSFKAIFTGHGWRGRAFLAWFFVASIYVLGFPALMSAATGYVSPSTAGIRMPDQTFISLTSSEIANCFNIARLISILGNSSLIGLDSNETLIFGPSIQEFDFPKELGSSDDKLASFSPNYPVFMDMFKAYSHPNRTYGYPFDGINVTAFPYMDNEPDDVQFTTNITLHGTVYKFNYFDPAIYFEPRYSYKKQLLPYDLSSMAYCLPGSYFVWGFSSLLLYIICSLQIAWTAGMFIVWLDANINSQLCRTGRKTRSTFRSALDIAEAVREVLGEDLCAYPNAEIAHTLETMRIGVQYYAADIDGSGVSHIGLSSNRSGQLSLKTDTIYGGSSASQGGKAS